MLVAKAIQQWPLYSGQETSTRYIDMSQQAMIDPVGTRESKTILDKWLKFYIGSQEKVATHLRVKYFKKSDEYEKVYEKAIKARVFDIMRGFLPAGMTTQLSWHTNLRQAHDHLALLHYWPLEEVKNVAQEIHNGLKIKYASSFSHKEYSEQEAYRELLGKQATYYLPKKFNGKFKFSTRVTPADLKPSEKLLKSRSQKTNLPLFLAEFGMLSFDFLLDFGSFRDIHRHRNGVCRMPLLTTKFGFQNWYLEQLPTDLRTQAIKLIKRAKIAIAKLKTTPEIKQYYTAMGFNVACKVSYGLPATVYTAELRSGRLVHPTCGKWRIK